MRFGQLIQEYTEYEENWQDKLKQRMLELYPHTTDGDLGAFVIISQRLVDRFDQIDSKILESSKNKYLKITYVDENDPFFDVGFIEQNQTHNRPIDFMTFDEVSAMNVYTKTLAQYPILDIICHVIWELTFWGWSDEEISSVDALIDDSIDEIEDENYHLKKWIKRNPSAIPSFITIFLAHFTLIILVPEMYSILTIILGIITVAFVLIVVVLPAMLTKLSLYIENLIERL